MCYHKDCQKLKESFLPCPHCNHYLCKDHKLSFQNYLLNGVTSDMENNHFSYCDLKCCFSTCSEKGLISDSWNGVKLYCFKHYATLNLNIDIEKIKTIKKKYAPFYENYVEAIENIKNKKILNDYYFNYGEIAQYVIEFFEYLNQLYKCLFLDNSLKFFDESERKNIKEQMIEFSLFILHKTINYLEKIEIELFRII